MRELKERVEFAIDPKLLDGYVGRYQLRPNFVVTISRSGDQLSAQATGQNAFQIFPESNREFFGKTVDIQFRFETDEQGKAVAVHIMQGGPGTRAPRVE